MSIGFLLAFYFLLYFHIEVRGFDPTTLGFEAQVSASFATEASCLYFAYCFTCSNNIGDLPQWFLTLEAPCLLFDVRSPTLELPLRTCLSPKASPLLPSNFSFASTVIP